MGTRRFAALACVAVAAGLVAAPGAAASAAPVRAGAAAVDASWHVGASAGQYAADCFDDPDENFPGRCTFVSPEDGTFDPTAHSYRRGPSYGIQSRLDVRALVVRGPDGTRIALVETPLYIPQDLLHRRAAHLLEREGECGITRETLTMAATHNHSSPFYSSTSWGVWAFQDAFDIRFYEYMAERIFSAVERACAGLVPVRVGASVNRFDKTHRHSFGPAIADDGTPAGYPQGETDHDMAVVRLDDVSDPERPRPLAALVNFSLHPEFLEGNNLISGDYLAPLHRMFDRRSGAISVFTQNAVGTSEPERSVWHSVHERLQFSHRDYGQADYGARLMADAALDAWADVAAGTPEEPERFVAFRDSFRVDMVDRWYPGPLSHPYPGVSSCRTDAALGGDPRLPVVGLPDCQGLEDALGTVSDIAGGPDVDLPIYPIDPGLATDDFERAGIPVPENYSAPSYTGLEEDIDVHLQAFRLGQILFTVCSCEQWFDQSANIETRTDTIAGNEHVGYDWGELCEPNGDGTYEPDGSGTGTWSCPNPHAPAQDLEPVSDLRYRRMRAQVTNPANGWNDLENVAWAESEPADPRRIRGNYTHDDRCGEPLAPASRPCGQDGRSPSAALGYDLTIPISMANDYNGYIATYREYQRGDHYRKALTGWGPHSSDYLATRLVTLGRLMKAPALKLPRDQVQEQALAAKVAADLAVNDLRAAALGTVGSAAIDAFDAALPDDGGEPVAVVQPVGIERFGAALFTWNGGSNYTDNPVVRVLRRDGTGGWTRYADQSGELPVTLEFPQGPDVASYLLGDQEWHWTAHFEAFVAPFDTGERPRATPAGTYRFAVRGLRREGGQAVPYHLRSEPFRVRPWRGITVEDLRVEPDGTVSFRVGPHHTYRVGGDDSEVEELNGGPPIVAEVGPIDYPDSYPSSAPFIEAVRTAERDPAAPGDPARLEWYCFRCSFRPWLDSGDADSARLVFAGRDGRRTVAALPQGGRWESTEPLAEGERAWVPRGGVEDPYGDQNGERSATVAR